LTALAIIFDGVDIQLLAISIPSIMQDWSVQRSAFAPILALGLFGMMIGGALAGIAGDKLGRKVALTGSVLLFAIMTIAISMVSSLSALGVIRFIAGLGLGGALPNAAALASEFVPKRHRPFAVTLTIVCVPLGGTIAGSVAIQVLPTLGWRALFLIGGVLPVIVAAVLMILLPESPRFLAQRRERWPELVKTLTRAGYSVPPNVQFTDVHEQGRERTNVGTLLTSEFRRDTVALWGSFFSCLLAVYLGLNWVPSMLTGAGLSATVGSAGITAFNMGGVAGAIIGALAFARLGSRPTMLTMSAGAILGAFILRGMVIAADSDTAPIIAMLGVTGGLINAVQTTMYALAAQVYPTVVRATGVGSAMAIGRSGAILSSYIGAWALGAGGTSLFFLLIGSSMTVCFFSLASIRRHIAADERHAKTVVPAKTETL
jgi:AAHS family 4-hydroxybenzoate transporter-like MFS transporter